MDAREPYAFSDAVFIVRVRAAADRGAAAAPLTLALEDVATGKRYAFSHERELADFLARYANRRDDVAC